MLLLGETVCSNICLRHWNGIKTQPLGNTIVSSSHVFGFDTRILINVFNYSIKNFNLIKRRPGFHI